MPVCDRHWFKYLDEAEAGLPLMEREILKQVLGVSRKVGKLGWTQAMKENRELSKPVTW